MSNNPSFDHAYKVAYPSAERAYAFVNSNKIPFSEAVIGITMPTPCYKMNRGSQTLVNLFEYIIEGEGKVLVNGQWVKASAGDFYILRSSERQCYQASETNPWKKLWINYTASYVPSLMNSYGVESGIYRADGAREIFERLVALPHSSKDKMDIAYEISDGINEIIKLASRVSAIQKDGGYLLKSRIEAYVHRRFSLDELSDELHISKSNLIRVFKREYGITPYEYLLELKIRTAKALLKSTGLPIKRIAEKICISDEHYFSSLFLKRVGMRPGEYRRSKADG